jgi:hypothetical protein
MTILQPQDIAVRLHRSVRWVYDNGNALGGVKIAGSWFFTQEGLENAIVGQGEGNLESTSQTRRAKISSQLQNKKRSIRVGAQEAQRVIRRTKEDNDNRHGLGDLL